MNIDVKKFSIVGFVSGLILLGFVPLAYAQNAYLDGNSETTVGLSGVVDVDLDASADVEAGTTGIVGTEGDTGTGSDTDADTGMNVTVGAGGVDIVITRSSAAANNTATVTTPTSVSTSADLSAYASTVVRTDERVDGVELSEASVSLAYKVHAKLFGIFPVLIPATATVNASGETTVKYPWYAFFAAIDSELVESNVRAATSATVSANANIAFSASTQALLLSQIYSVMKTDLEASLAAEAAASASAR